MDRWQTLNVVCDGGLDTTVDILEQGAMLTGSARELINYEPAEDRGYRKVAGYIKYDEDVVPGDADEPVLGVHPFKEGVVAARLDTSGSTDNALYYSTGSGWTQYNSAARGGSPSRVRFITYNITEDITVSCDGVNPAIKFDGSSDTLLNGTGAPSDPSYAAEFLNRLVLSGYSSNVAAITISAPNDDEDYTAANGAIELNVGDEVVGLFVFRDTLFIFCVNSIHRLEGSTSSDFIVRSVTDRIGCLDGDTIQEVAGDLIFLAPDGFRSLAATERIGDVELGLQSKAIQDDIRDVIAVNPANYSSLVIPDKSQYRCFYHITGRDDDSQKGFLGKYKPTENGKQYQWAQLLGFPAYSAGYGILNDSTQLAVIGHPDNGYVYQLEQTGGRDGSDISYSFKSPPLIFEDISRRKVMHSIRPIIEPEGSFDLSFKLILDEFSDRDRVQPSAKSITLSESGAVFGVAVFDTDVFGGEAEMFMTRRKVEGSGNTVTFQFFGSDTSLPHRIDSYTIEYAIKGRR